MQYYFSIDGTTQQGPLDAQGLRAAGVHAGTMVWREGMPDWLPAGQVSELAGLFAGIAPPPGAPTIQSPGGYVSPPAGGFTAQPGAHVQQPLNYSPPPGNGTNGMGIASLACGICGLLGFCCCPALVTSILAVIFGHIARGQIRRGHGTGDTIALTGLILGYIGIALALLGLTVGLSSHGIRTHGPNFNWKVGP